MRFRRSNETFNLLLAIALPCALAQSALPHLGRAAAKIASESISVQLAKKRPLKKRPHAASWLGLRPG